MHTLFLHTFVGCNTESRQQGYAFFSASVMLTHFFILLRFSISEKVTNKLMALLFVYNMMNSKIVYHKNHCNNNNICDVILVTIVPLLDVFGITFVRKVSPLRTFCEKLNY